MIMRRGLIDEWSHENDTVALVIYDRGTGDLACYPAASRDTEDTLKGLHNFIGNNE